MKSWWPNLVVIALLVIIVALPLAFRSASEAGSAPQSEPTGRLVIVSPHNEQIRFEFEHGFNAWLAGRGEGPIEIDWRSGGGTSDLRRIVLSQFEAAAEAGAEDDGIGIDLFFGGGEYDHNRLARGVTVDRGGEHVSIPVSAPIPLDRAFIEGAFPSPVIGGERLYHPDLLWVGTALSSFGIVYNRDVVDMLGQPEPRMWDDLARPAYRNWVALADPGHSGSITVTMETVLRRRGWTQGWKTLRRAFANARYFAEDASKVPVDVANGEAALGMCIDFYGRFQAGAIGGDRVGYVDPPFMTAITADPITLIRGAPHRELAVKFIRYNLLPEGQRLWQRRRGEPGGPVKFELRRLPGRRDLYTPQEMATWRDSGVDPFGIAKPFPEGVPSVFRLVAPVSHAMAVDIHDELIAAWDAICENPDHPRRDEMLAAFDRMPDALTLQWPDDELAEHWHAILEDPDHGLSERRGEVVATLNSFVDSITAHWQGDEPLKDRLEWTLFFREQYRRVQRIAEE